MPRSCVFKTSDKSPHTHTPSSDGSHTQSSRQQIVAVHTAQLDRAGVVLKHDAYRGLPIERRELHITVTTCFNPPFSAHNPPCSGIVFRSRPGPLMSFSTGHVFPSSTLTRRVMFTRPVVVAGFVKSSAFLAGQDAMPPLQPGSGRLGMGLNVHHC